MLVIRAEAKDAIQSIACALFNDLQLCGKLFVIAREVNFGSKLAHH